MTSIISESSVCSWSKALSISKEPYASSDLEVDDLSSAKALDITLTVWLKFKAAAWSPIVGLAALDAAIKALAGCKGNKWFTYLRGRGYLFAK